MTTLALSVMLAALVGSRLDVALAIGPLRGPGDLEGTWVGRCKQFGSAKSDNSPSTCLPYAAKTPISFTYNVTYDGNGGVKYYEASAQSVTYKNVVYSYPLQRDSGVVLRMSNYSGSGSATYQSCMTIQFKKYGQATYLAGLSTINGIDYYNEEGIYTVTGNKPVVGPSAGCKTSGKLFCSGTNSRSGTFNYVCQLARFRNV